MGVRRLANPADIIKSSDLHEDLQRILSNELEHIKDNPQLFSGRQAYASCGSTDFDIRTIFRSDYVQNRQQTSASSLLNNFGHPRRAVTPTRRNVQRNKHQRSRS